LTNKQREFLLKIYNNLATWEAEIGRTTDPDQPRKKKFMRSLFNGKMLGLMACTSHPGDRGEA
jgi:hypothetical protein